MYSQLNISYQLQSFVDLSNRRTSLASLKKKGQSLLNEMAKSSVIYPDPTASTGGDKLTQFTADTDAAAIGSGDLEDMPIEKEKEITLDEEHRFLSTPNMPKQGKY